MKSTTFLLIALLCAFTTLSFAPLHADAAEDASFDLSPVIVQPFSVSTEPDAARKAWEQKMNLEDGVEVHGTRYITDQDVTTRDLFILQITQSLEGGFDSTNMYDRGLLSWGLMQWATHSGSLDGVLLYMKQRLSASDGRLWHKLFVDNGLDVDKQGIMFYGKHPASVAERRVDLRGSATPGKFDPNLVDHWATVMARAGRQPEIQQLEIEYAGKVVDGVLDRQVPGLDFHAPGREGVTPEDLAGSDPYAEALIFVIWTNNPTHAWQYIADSARAARAATGEDDPSQWPAGTFTDALLRHCKDSRFGNWSRRAALIEARALAVRVSSPTDLTPFEQTYQVVLAARKERHYVELASRHMEMERSFLTRKAPLSRPVRIAAALPKPSIPHPAAPAAPPAAPPAATAGTVVIPPDSVLSMDPTVGPNAPTLDIEHLDARNGAM